MRRRDFAKRLFGGTAVAAVIGAKDDEESKLSDVEWITPEPVIVAFDLFVAIPNEAGNMKLVSLREKLR